MAERGWQTLAWGVAAVVAVLAAVRLLGPSSAAPPPVQVGGPAGAQARAGPPARRAASGPYVHVAGAVRRPGVYRLAAGARVEAAVRRAGGATAAADLDAVNLAAPLRDGQQVVVPARAAGAGAATEGPIGLGAATAEQLESVDGIGSTLAERIVAERQARGGFASVEQLRAVDGIGEQRLEALRAALTP